MMQPRILELWEKNYNSIFIDGKLGHMSPINIKAQVRHLTGIIPDTERMFYYQTKYAQRIFYRETKLSNIYKISKIFKNINRKNFNFLQIDNKTGNKSTKR